MNNERPTHSQVEAWLHGVRTEIAGIQEKLEQLQDQRSRLESQESAFLSLAASINGGKAPPGKSRTTKKQEVEGRVVEILEEAGTELHINEIHSRYKERGWRIPGAGKSNNITAHIGYSDRIESPRWGWYRLANISEVVAS